MTTAAPAAGVLLGEAGESLDAYRRAGGYAPLPDPAAIRCAAERLDLRGAGGAGFPTATKLAAVAAGSGPRAVVVNGEEGEPASLKDRWLLRSRPHLVLDGLRAAAACVDADHLVAYVSDPASAERLRAALAEAPAALQSVRVELVEPAYVAGEETAVVNRLNGGEAKPLPKPPRPYEQGLGNRPTLVLNVETVARLALAVREDGVAREIDTMLATVLVGGEAVLVEARRGERLAAVVGRHPRWADVEPRALLVGGFAGGVWPADILSVEIGHDSLRERGALWGCGAVVVLDGDDCVVSAALDVATYLRDSSSGQCGSCVRGTQVVVEQLARIAAGAGSEEDVEQLRRRADALVGRGNCALPDADAVLVRTLLTNFAAEIDDHLRDGCDRCRETVGRPAGTDTRFRALMPPARADDNTRQEMP